MKKIISLVVLSALALPVYAQSVEQYLSDTSDASVRLEIVQPSGSTEPVTFWGRIKGLLGVRAPARQKPAVGTKFIVQSSAYASSPYQTDATPCVTAAGTRVRPGVVASNFLPIGTLLDINGEEYIVEDRMNSRYSGYFIDLWFPSTSSALEFGRRKQTVTVKGYTEAGAPIREVKQKVELKKEPIAEEQIGDPSVWTRLADTVTTLANYIGAKVSKDVNRFDVDCMAKDV
ncbi:MAG: 3D domain-containing protein [Candidatus Andersenbacteria bacterium]|nr:3D domain-containing protein [Candidatus Andersenbacteria bacterium]MBI3250638.1 3D domain-containing protein [Candidatus Andersenbacteria bacterium]